MGKTIYLLLDQPLSSQDIPPGAILIVDNRVGIPLNVESISGLRLNLADYEFSTTRLGRGSFGNVMKGCCTRSGCYVALKQLYNYVNESSLDFWREVHIPQSIRHPCIMPIHGYLPACEATDGVIVLVCGFMANGSLQDVVSGNPSWWDTTAKVKVLLGIAAGMNAVHKANCIHRDLKPENVLIDEFGDPHIGDFGSAKSMGDAKSIQNSMACGTPYYLSPETIEDRAVGNSTDVYSFGIMVHVVLTGGPPYTPAQCRANLLRIVAKGLRPQFPEGTNELLVALATNCWKGNPGIRPAFADVVHDLCGQGFLESMPELDLTILRDFASRTVPPELRGFLARDVETMLFHGYLLAKCKFEEEEPETEDEYFVINSLFDHRGGTRSIAELREAYQLGAELGDPTAMCESALSMSESDGENAVKLMKQAADRGCGRAGIYYIGMVGDQSGDVEKYRYWENTQYRCQKVFDFASAYHRGTGVEQNIGEAIRLYELAADCGHSESCFALSEIYRRGDDGISPNPARSILYARRNYEKGMEAEQVADGRDFLGLLSFAEFQSLPPQANPEAAQASGEGPIPKDEECPRFGTIPIDEEQSRKLLEMAHRKCFAFQQYRYAQRLKSGRGVEQDDEESDYYFNLAVLHGFPVPARDSLKK
jgi:serine/threonine protein kinase